MNGQLGNGPLSTGWVGRWLDGQPAATADLAAASLDSSVPLAHAGRGASCRRHSAERWHVRCRNRRVRRADVQRAAVARRRRAPGAERCTTRSRRRWCGSSTWRPRWRRRSRPHCRVAAQLTRKLTIAARLINANIGLRVFDIARSGFDTHDSQTNAMPGLLQRPERRAAGLLRHAVADVPQPGDDHDGVGVRAHRRVERLRRHRSRHGEHELRDRPQRPRWPVRADAVADQSRPQRSHGARRSTSGRCTARCSTAGWVAAAARIINGGFENLGLFQRRPRLGAADDHADRARTLGRQRVRLAGAGAPVRHARRQGWPRRCALQQGEEWSFPLAGQYGIPPEATAVAINLTAVDATAPTYVTVWPGGTARPVASNLNPVPGVAVPNLVVTQLGPAGSIGLFNNSGQRAPDRRPRRLLHRIEQPAPPGAHAGARCSTPATARAACSASSVPARR